MYHLRTHRVRELMYRLDYTSRYSYTAIQRDTSEMMYPHPSDQVIAKIICAAIETGLKIIGVALINLAPATLLLFVSFSTPFGDFLAV